eukprot:2341897-Alexandrium_andersonii.AAC.1
MHYKLVLQHQVYEAWKDEGGAQSAVSRCPPVRRAHQRANAVSHAQANRGWAGEAEARFLL